jgi:hypothetical protein
LILLTLNIILFFIGKELYFGHYADHLPEQKACLLSDSHGQAVKDFAEKYGVHNFSYGSDSYQDMYRKTLYLIRNSQPEAIFISVDEHSLTSYRERKNNLDRSVIYCEPEDLGYYEYFKQEYLKHYIALFRPEIAEVIKIYKFPSDKKPVLWASRSAEDRINRAVKRVAVNFPDEEQSERLKQSLQDIIDLCKKNNIELIGIKFPLSKEYLEAAEGYTGDADELLMINGYEVLDCTELYIDRPEFFADQDHLNDEGAKDLVEKIFSPE